MASFAGFHVVRSAYFGRRFVQVPEWAVVVTVSAVVAGTWRATRRAADTVTRPGVARHAPPGPDRVDYRKVEMTRHQSPATAGPVRLAGGNPRVAKGDGDEPVRAFIAAMPGWQAAVGRRLDELVVAAVPGVSKAVRWNSPFYGVAGRGWFLSFHCTARYVKVAFFGGTSLDPMPPVASKVEGTRYVHIGKGEPIDEAAMTEWIRQAADRDGADLFSWVAPPDCGRGGRSLPYGTTSRSLGAASRDK